MSLEVTEKIEPLQQADEKSFDDLVAEFYAWLTPPEKLWEDDEDQLADLFTEFLRSPLRAVPEATITHLQGEFYTWMKHHSDRVHFLAKKLRQPTDRLGSPPNTTIEPWDKRWNKAQMEKYAQPQSQKEPTEPRQLPPQITTLEKPLRD